MILSIFGIHLLIQIVPTHDMHFDSHSNLHQQPFMKLCIKSQYLQDFILTRLDLMTGMRKKGKNTRRGCKKGKSRIGGEAPGRPN